jgi:L-lactate utilization protein LutB
MNRLKQIATLRQALIRQNPGLASRVTAIREKSIENLPDLLLKAQETLAGKLAKVYTANNRSEAEKILGDLLKNEKNAARAYSNTLAEVGFDRMMSDLGVKVKLTSIEEIVRIESGRPAPGHPQLATLDLSSQVIEEALRRFIGEKGKTSLSALKQQAVKRIKADILQCDFGVTGANSIVAENGVLVLAEDEGNVRAVSNLPYRHVAVVGLDKLNWSVEDSMSIIQASAIFGTGRITPTYYSLIAGPSRTGDIEFRMAYGMHGPKEVHVILLNNGRLAIRDQGAGALLKCINCGSCYESCVRLARTVKWKDVMFSPKAMALGLVQGLLPKIKAKTAMAEFLCPVGLSSDEVVKKLGLITAI